MYFLFLFFFWIITKFSLPKHVQYDGLLYIVKWLL